MDMGITAYIFDLPGDQYRADSSGWRTFLRMAGLSGGCSRERAASRLGQSPAGGGLYLINFGYDACAQDQRSGPERQLV
jgi:hypothetical protein